MILPQLFTQLVQELIHTSFLQKLDIIPSVQFMSSEESLESTHAWGTFSNVIYSWYALSRICSSHFLRMEGIQRLINADCQMISSSQDRIAHLRTFLEKPHAKEEQTGLECNGDWLLCAKQILSWNNIPLRNWQAIVTRCLTMGRRKNNNVFLYGEANCGKVCLFFEFCSIVF